LHVCAVAAQASPGRVYPPGSGLCGGEEG